MEKTKIAFFMASPFTYGGEQRVVSVVASLLSKRTYDVSIICTLKVKEDYEMYDLDKNVKIIYIPKSISSFETFNKKVLNKILMYNKKIGILKNFPNIEKKLFATASFKKRLVKKINEEKFDYVIGVATKYIAITGIINKKITAKTIAWQHNNYIAYFETKERGFYNFQKMFNKIYPTFDNYIVLLKDDKEKLDAKFEKKCKQIYNPTSFREEGNCDLNSKTFLIYGRLDTNKGYDLLVDAYKKYKDMGGTWKLNIVGDGIEKNNIINDIKNKKLESYITIYPFTNNIKEYLEHSSCLVFPSRWEGCSLVFNEALQFGLPIICFDILNFREISKGYDSAILNPQFDTYKFAESMLKVEKDKKLLKYMSEEAHRNSKILNDEEIVNQWMQILK